MPLNREQIIQKELDYFKSPLAEEPAFIQDHYGEDYFIEDAWCVYKTEDGRKCAVGALIKPAHYKHEFDANNGIPVDRLSDEVLDYLGHENISWLKDLQACHDDCARNWKFEQNENDHFGRFFLKVAKNQGLL